MTPLEFAQALAQDLEASYGASLVSPYTAQLGDVVIDCAGVFVTLLTLSEQDAGGGNCDPVPMADVVVAVARDCSFAADEDGTTNRAAMDQVSAALDHDAVALGEWADKQYAESWFRLGRPSITFSVSGGLASVILNLSLPVP